MRAQRRGGRRPDIISDMTPVKAWALVDSLGEVVFVNHQAEIYSDKDQALVSNAEQDDAYRIVEIKLACQPV